MGRCGSPAEESQEPRFAGAWGLREHLRIRRGWQLICRRTCSNVTPCLGALAQLVARLGRIEKVTGSTPVCSTKMKNLYFPHLVVGQFCFCGDFGRSIDVDVGEDTGGGQTGSVDGVSSSSTVMRVNRARLRMCCSASSL